jgi:hypothetical protein
MGMVKEMVVLYFLIDSGFMFSYLALLEILDICL